MGSPTGFLEHERHNAPKRPVDERVRDYREIEGRLSPDELRDQAARCMECGIPYCHAHGCPLANRIPEFNDAVYRGHWRRALDLLHATNNFPEVTGRICPAPCEASCSLAVNIDPVSIRHIELQIVERGWEEGWIRPEPAQVRTGKRIAVVGSGPAGLAAAQQLARAGHDVTVLEKAPKIGGILRYGIPDYKLEKTVLDRRLEQMKAERVVFETGVEVGVDLSARYLRRSFDAVLLTTGAAVPRDLPVPGRGLEGIHFAMEFLTQQNRLNDALDVPYDIRINAAGKDVVIIGGGDTGADCVGTSRRQGAASITQIELLPEPPAWRKPDNPWPTWPNILRTATSHEEGCKRLWSCQTRRFLGQGTRVRALECVRLDWSDGPRGRPKFTEREGTEFELKADLVLLAMGFVHAEHGRLVRDLELETDDRGNLRVTDYATSVPGVFSAGDAMTGASLVVRAIAHGREAADYIDTWLADAS